MTFLIHVTEPMLPQVMSQMFQFDVNKHMHHQVLSQI